ncbi:MAG: hypothetical protein PHY73_07750 [Candidatus Omnitrophica bacterium]|nr:hypothetical protein [Candidatus Omnitrophota bacterium]
MTLIIATAIIMALSILAVSVISLAGSQAYLGQAQVDKIKAEQLAKGAFWVNYMNLLTNHVGFQLPVTTLDGKPFKITITTDAGTGLDGTDTVETEVSF